MATAPQHADRTASEARRPGSRNPGRRRQPSGARERWKPVRGETPQAARCATRTTARPAMLLGRGRTAFKARCTSSCASHRETGSTATTVVWPIRRSRFGGIEGRQASRGGDSPQGFPLEASEARSAPGAKVSATGAAEKKCAAPAGTTHRRLCGAISSPPAQSSTATGRSRQAQRTRKPARPRSAR